VYWSGSALGQEESSCECGNEPPGSIKRRESVEWLNNMGLSSSGQLQRESCAQGEEHKVPGQLCPCSAREIRPTQFGPL
jgi:hypothetical protein